MDQLELANQFDGERPRLRRIAYRILGSLNEADDAVQEAWLRLRRTDSAEIDNFEAWLTTVVSRICLNLLRGRASRREDLVEALTPEPIVEAASGEDPEYEAVLADSVRRVLDGAPEPEPDLARQRAVVEAFFAASREGDLDALIAVLDPDVVIRSHSRTGVKEVRGAAQAARGAVMWRRWARSVRPALINGAAGVVAYDGDRPFALLAFTVIGERAVAIDVFNDRDLVPKLLRAGSTGAARF